MPIHMHLHLLDTRLIRRFINDIGMRQQLVLARSLIVIVEVRLY